MRKFALPLLASAAFLAACGGGAPKTQAELLLGEWDQTDPVTITQDGQTVMISEGEVEFDDDGTSEGEALMTITTMPVEINTYRVKGNTSYVLAGNVITETLTSGTVTPVGDAAQAVQIAEKIQASMLQAPSSSSTIVSLDKDTLVIRENESGAEITYKRD
ncbi:MAG: hypothetical protein ACSHX3_10700 [Litorimonas sp.]